MDTAAYLDRIGHAGDVAPTHETLCALHRAHLVAVPFENLDIHLGRPIVLDEAWLFRKIVGERRGGFCYELNGLFGSLLERLGFDVTRLSAGVTTRGRRGPEFDHLALLVRLDGPHLADVGFGQLFREPIRLVPGETQRRDRYAYRLEAHHGDWVLHESEADGGWEERYRFSLTRRELAEFAGMCRHHQESPDSSFTRSRVCTRATPDGRITLTEEAFVETVDGRRREVPLTGDAEYRRLLRDRFGIDVGDAPWRRQRPSSRR